MRPSGRLIALAAAAFSLSIGAVSLGLSEGRWPVAGWLLLVLILAADLILSRRRGIAIAATGPQEIFVGERGHVGFDTAAGPPGLVGRLQWPDGLEGPAEFALAAPGTQVSVRAKRRGLFVVERLWLAWPSRFGLLEFVEKQPVGLSIAAIPNIRPVQSGAIDVRVRSTLFGVKENFAKGEGSEFHQLREFQSGMDPRSIDWKRSARHHSLLAKETRAERNHHVIVALDNGHLMREEIEGIPKIDHAVNAALGTTWAAGLGGDLVGLFVYDAAPRVFLPPTPGRHAFTRIRSRAAQLEYNSVETNHTLGLSTLFARTPRRSLIVLFSDFFDTTGAALMVDNVGALLRRHAVIVVALQDPDVQRMVRGGSRSLDDVARSVVATEVARERQRVMEQLQQLGVTVVDVPPKAVTARLISTYLDLKSREII